MAKLDAETKRLVREWDIEQGLAPYGFIYFIEAVGAEMIKIGWTENHPDKRLSHLQVGSCFPLKPLGVLVKPNDWERQMHERFAAARGVGEWFRASKELRGFIATSTRDWPTQKHFILRPGMYEVDHTKDGERWAPQDARCDYCRAPVYSGSRWFVCKSKQGDRFGACFDCVRRQDGGLRCWLKITSVTYEPS